MRTLYYVPMIHSSADMASLEPALESIALKELGNELWLQRREAVSGFWNSISAFFGSLDAQGFRIYQDSLIAEGDAGTKIVDEGVKAGSRNYEIISLLLKNGAILTRTEDIYWVKREYDMVVGMTKAKTSMGKQVAALRYSLARKTLLKERDSIIIKRIDETLGYNEKGILFLGAYHDVISKLPADIEINQVKDVVKIRDFNRILPAIRNKTHWCDLVNYLASPVQVTKYQTSGG